MLFYPCRFLCARFHWYFPELRVIVGIRFVKDVTQVFGAFVVGGTLTIFATEATPAPPYLAATVFDPNHVALLLLLHSPFGH